MCAPAHHRGIGVFMPSHPTPTLDRNRHVSGQISPKSGVLDDGCRIRADTLCDAVEFKTNRHYRLRGPPRLLVCWRYYLAHEIGRMSMRARTSVIPVVTLCDSRGRMIWTNHPSPEYKPGVPIWDYAVLENRELVKDQIARTLFLNEPQEFEASSDRGERYHVWVWPMNLPELGVAIVGLQMPDDVKLLTVRERECLEMLAEGHSTAEISKAFDVSISTVHTYLKRSREKLRLSSLEQLIAFASRYLPQSPHPPRES